MAGIGNGVGIGAGTDRICVVYFVAHVVEWQVGHCK